METLRPAGQPAISGYLEVLGRSGRVVARLPLRVGAVRIGRGYDNDLVLDDAYVCPHHVTLTIDDTGARIEDQGSVNGVVTAEGVRVRGGLLLRSGDVVRLGHTSLRYRGSHHPLEKTRVDRGTSRVVGALNRLPVLVLLYLFTGATMLWEMYLDSGSGTEPEEYLAGLFAAAAIVIGWSAVWSFASRMVMHRWNFLAHCGIACAGLLGYAAVQTVVGVVAFAFAMDWLPEPVSGLSIAGAIAGAVYLHLRFATLATASRLAWSAVGVAGLVLAAVSLGLYAGDAEFSAAPEYSVTLQVPALLVTHGETPEGFFRSLGDLRGRVESRLQEE